MQPNVTTIPATITPQKQSIFDPGKKRRVAAYARVSTDSDEQFTSFEAQVEYYTKYINGNEGWELAGIYTDEGISAVNTKRRDGFKRMIQDAMSGKIDLIITKSVSRFARNTVDSLTAVRDLKAKGVECYFEKENIFTFDGKGELLITIMSSLAQEEARSISENVTWGQRRGFEQGKVHLPYTRFLGYERGENGRPKVVEKEAAIVREIFSLFLNGFTPGAISRMFTDRKLPSPGGSDRWHSTTVLSILENEKYKGEALLQKTVGVDFLEKSRKRNEGEAPQYHVTNSHDAIVRPEVFDLVQDTLRKQRSAAIVGRSCTHPFSTRIFCGECGRMYGSKGWRSSKNKVPIMIRVWQCNERYRVKGRKSCKTPHLRPSQIEYAFITAFNQILREKEQYIAEYGPVIEMLTDCAALEKEAATLREQRDELVTLIQTSAAEQVRRVNDLELLKRHEKLVERHEAVKARLQETVDEIASRTVKRTRIEAFLEELKAQPNLLQIFDEKLWRATIERLIVNRESDVMVEFKDGRQIRVSVIGQ